tara:strand:+ start:613 stop:828 length:216 start_codon:yes stop_codon:yes gene_type:complete
MSKEFERYLIVFLVLILIGLSGCANKYITADHPKQPTTLETIGKLDAIANVLGCMFDPAPCQKKSKEEMDR